MGGLYRFDIELFRFVHIGLHRDWLDPVFWVISTSGLGYVQAVVVLLFGIQKRFRGYVMPMLLTLLVSGVPVAQGIKHLFFDRDRPSGLPWAHPQEQIFGNSFPSGHTTSSFAFATMLYFLLWDTPYRKAARWGFLWAALVGMSRMYRGVHWPTDVIGGAFAGVGSAALVYLLWPKRPDGS